MTSRTIKVIALVALPPLLAAACGSDDNPAADQDDARTIEVEMVDIAYKPTTLNIPRGESVKFLFTNKGKVAHDAFIGDTAAQAEHEMDMADDGGHGGHGAKADAVTVQPGDTGELTYHFDDDSSIEIGCHQPGHYDAGMKINVAVR